MHVASRTHVSDKYATGANQGSMHVASRTQRANTLLGQEALKKKRPSTKTLHAGRAQLSKLAQSTTKSFQLSQSTTTQTFQFDKHSKKTFKLGQTTTQTIHVGQTTITTACHHGTPKHASNAYQFRAAGPMILRNPTQKEIHHLRLVASLPNSPIRYIVMRFLPAPENYLLVFAQAVDKHTATAWKKLLVSRMEQVSPPSRSVLHAIKICQGLDFNEKTQEYSISLTQKNHPRFEEYGSPSRIIRQDQQTLMTALPASSGEVQSRARPHSQFPTFIPLVPATSVKLLASSCPELPTHESEVPPWNRLEIITQPSKASQAYAMAMRDHAILADIPGLWSEKQSQM